MSLEHYFGLNEFLLRQKSQSVKIYYAPEKLINGHMLLCGMSGTGKSYQTKRILNSAAHAGIEIDIFDVHEELEGVTGAVACKYSQANNYGYNPLVINDDPHSGGVNIQVNFIVKLVREAGPMFGAKQDAALRYLLLDVYAMYGILQSDRSTWRRKQMTERYREQLIDEGRTAELKSFYPTLEDLKLYAKRKISALMIGSDNKAISALERLKKMKSKLQSLLTQRDKSSDDEDIERLSNLIEDQKTKCTDTYSTFIAEMKTGRELDDMLKYDSVDVLQSVLQRLDVMVMAGGLFSSNPPPFNHARIRCHQLKSISTAQQVMFVKLRLLESFERFKRMGPTSSGTEIRYIAFLDEAHKYFTEEDDNIINVIAKEGRKFGMALWCASQQPTEFPESFLTNVGATVLLGVHSSFWKRTMSMLRITEDQLKYIRPKEVICIKQQRDGASDPPFQNVIVPNPSNPQGIEAGKYA